MALVRQNLAQFENETIYIDVIYDNVTGIIREVIVRNRSTRVIVATITLPDGTTKSVEFTHLPGPADEEVSRTIPVPRRPNINTMSIWFGIRSV